MDITTVSLTGHSVGCLCRTYRTYWWGEEKRPGNTLACFARYLLYLHAAAMTGTHNLEFPALLVCGER